MSPLLDKYLKLIQEDNLDEISVGKLAPEVVKAAEKTGAVKKAATFAASGIDDIIAALIYQKAKRRGRR